MSKKMPIRIIFDNKVVSKPQLIELLNAAYQIDAANMNMNTIQKECMKRGRTLKIELLA